MVCHTVQCFALTMAGSNFCLRSEDANAHRIRRAIRISRSVTQPHRSKRKHKDTAAAVAYRSSNAAGIQRFRVLSLIRRALLTDALLHNGIDKGRRPSVVYPAQTVAFILRISFATRHQRSVLRRASHRFAI